MSDSSQKRTTFKEIKTVIPFPGVGGDYPRPENTPGVFIEHFDLSWPLRDGQDGIIYRWLYEAAKEAATIEGWAFRSYSVVATPGTDADWVARQIRSFPTLILFRDGVELGRHTYVNNSVPGILFWAKKLLGIECEEPVKPSMPAELRERSQITPSGIVLKRDAHTPLPSVQDPSTLSGEVSLPHETQRRSQTAATVLASHPNAKKTMDEDPDLKALREELERHFVSGTPLEVIYFGGGLPGASRLITPLRYCEERGRNYIIALCHRSGIEKTFRLDRMHLPGPPLPDGKNDFRTIANILGDARMLEGMLSQIARLGNLPLEVALAKHLETRGEFESFFDEYSYGGFTLELQLTAAVVYLSLGFEANDCGLMHYEFTPESEPRLTPGIATHYSLYAGGPAMRSS